MTTNIPPAERLLDLVIALSAGSGMTKTEIRTHVAGYGAAATDAGFARMFERDKDLLRELGVPLLTVVDPHFGDEVRYRIDTDAYSMAEIDLDPDELGVVAVAAQVWRDAAWQNRAGRAVTKLRALGAGGDAITEAPAIHLALAGDELDTVLGAISARLPVEFDYRAASTGELSHRLVEPWQVVVRGHAWYLVGFDRGRGASRSFRLGRVIGRIRTRTDLGPCQTPGPQARAAAMRDHGPAPVRTAVLALDPGAAPALRQRGRKTLDSRRAEPPQQVIEVSFTSVRELAGEVAAQGPGVVVLEPPDLREEVIRTLTVVAHG